MKTFITVKNTLLISLILFVTSMHAQVFGVKYLIKYDAKKDYFDCFLLIANGFAKDVNDRTQFLSNVSIVVPTGTEFNVIQSYMPLVNNQNFNSNRVAKWNITTKVKKPASRPRFDFFSVTPDLTEEAHYNEMQAGDTIKLFSFALDTLVGCADGIRLFVDGIDPDANSDDFMNQDLRQKFALGGPANVYITNAILSYPALAGKDENACKGQTLTLFPAPSTKGSWYLPASNPFGASLNHSNFNTDKVIFSPKAELGIYSVVYADSNSYDIKCITITQPTAKIMVDSTSCEGGFMTLNVSGNGSFAWSPLGGNSTTIRPMANTNYTVTVTDINGCTASTSIAVKAITDVIIPGKNICLGTTDILPNLALQTWHPLLHDGKWVSNNLAVATVSPNGVINPLTSGTVTFTYLYSDCYVTTKEFTIHPRPQVTVTGSNAICVGESKSFTTSGTGLWISSAPNILSINNQGIATGLNQGVANITFVQNATGCISDPKTINVKQKPTVAIVGPSYICVGNETKLSPQTGGIWTTDNIVVASVENSGLVTGLSAGSAQFIFLADNGCFSDFTPPVLVNPLPIVSLTGPNHICVQESTTLSPSTGGTWSSLSNTIATVNNQGIITGNQSGTTSFVFTSNAGCTSLPSPSVVVSARPSISIVGPNKICIGNQTNLTSPQSGTWISNAPNIASITTNGIITGLSSGDATFTFTVNGGCSTTSPIIEVMPLPVVPFQNLTLCMEESFTLSPAPSDSWQIHPSDIIIFNNNTFTPIKPGSAKLVFSDSSTGCKSDSIPVIVNPLPQIQLIDSNTICVGSTTSFSPTVGGSWITSAPSIATINGAGVVTGISQGQAYFTYTNTQTGCAAKSTKINILPIPTINLEDVAICLGSPIDYLPVLNGSWTAIPTGIVSIQDSIITAITPGTVNIIFTDKSTSCQADIFSITIHPSPSIQMSGNDTICIGSTTILTSSLTGSWAGSNFAIADITNIGLITGKSKGTVFFEFSSEQGCTASTQNITVNEPEILNITIQNNQIITGQNSNQYIWYDCSNNQLIATTLVPAFIPTYNGSYYLVIDDGICLNQSECIDFTLVSTNDALTSNIKIYPNPVSEVLTINSPIEVLNVVMKNSLGQTLANTSEIEINVSLFCSGIYLLEIETKQGRISKPVLIIK